MYNTLNWEPVIRLAAILIWVTIAGFALLLLYLRIGRGIAPAIFAVLAILLVVGDLFQAGFGENPAIPDSHAVQPVTPAIRYLQSRDPPRYVAVDPYVGFNPLPPDVNIDYGLYDARGYDLPVIDRFSELWSRYVAPATPLLPLDTPAVPILEIQLPPSGPPAMRILSLLGVRDLLEQKGESPLQMPGLHVVYDGSDATIYQNDNALPRTWLVADQDVIKGDAAELTAVGSTGFDPHNEVITGSAIPGIPDDDSDPSTPGTAGITDYQAQQVTIQAHANRAAELVLSDTYYPGWKVTVNGQPARIDEVDYLLRGVSVPAGNDRIVFTYDPSSFKEGWITSVAATIFLIVAVVVGLRRRKRHVHIRGRKLAVESMQSGTASGADVSSRSPLVHPLNT